MKGIGGIADYLILMAYDFQSFQKYTNANNVPAELVGKISDISLSLYSQPYVQPYDKVDGAVKEMLNSGVTPEKVILGVNLVGMKWIKYSKTVNGKNYFYYELGRPGLDTVESVSAEEQYIEKQAVSRKVKTADKLSQTEKQELQKNGDRVVSEEYHYESPKSLYLKYYNIVKSYKLSGITVWRIEKEANRYGEA
jgi:spore germination protein YaaH